MAAKAQGFQTVPKGPVTLAAVPDLQMTPSVAPKLSRAVEIIGQGYPGQAGRTLYQMPSPDTADLGDLNHAQAMPPTKAGGAKCPEPWGGCKK